MSCGSSRPLTHRLRALLSLVSGSEQTNDDRKLLDEFSLEEEEDDVKSYTKLYLEVQKSAPIK